MVFNEPFKISISFPSTSIFIKSGIYEFDPTKKSIVKLKVL